MKHWLFILILLPGVASASAYKCREPSGGTVYSTTPCEDTPGLTPYVADPAASDGQLVLRMGEDNTYRIPGEINGSAVNFVVDTAALHTAISQAAATAAGIQGCDSRAAGRCSVKVHEITFGGLELNDVPVDVMPNLPVDVQLGHDALKRLKVKEANGALYLSRR
jgi:predicted aspartyl protease